ncbi:MAG: response regulator [Candidatus Riflebacteria bacterium]|nr:response regulator [Candidatus Riflebacteria bacterium]
MTWRNRPFGILFRTVSFFLLVMIISLGSFAVFIWPLLRNTLEKSLEKQARTLSSSVAQVIISSIVTEDFGTAVEHCTKVLSETEMVRYIVVTRKDGFSLVHFPGGWRQETLQGRWNPPENFIASGGICKNELGQDEEVYSFSSPLKYFNIDWGAIHIGISIFSYQKDLRKIFRSTVLMIVICVIGGMFLSIFFSRRLVRPLHLLENFVGSVSSGNISARIQIKTSDEIENLANAFNQMLDALEKSREELITAEEYAYNVIRSIRDMVFVLSPSGEITRVNEETILALGYPEEKILGQPFSQYISNESGIFRFTWDKLIAEGRLYNHELSILCKDGKTISTLFSGTVMTDKSGKQIGVVVIVKDISELRKAQVQLIKAMKEAEEANRAKSDFLRNVSHELRTPMNGILGMTEFLLDTKLTDEQRRFTQMCRMSGQNLLDIINDVLDFSNIEAGKLKIENMAFDLRMTVEDSVELISTRAHEKGIEIGLLIDEEVGGQFIGDPGRIRQILLNLLGNAVKFTKKGEVFIHLKNKFDDDCSSLLEASITDTGIGIPKECRDRLFLAFSQADGSHTRQFGGAGLGLVIARSLIEMMHGEIGFESTEGVGSKFWFTIRLEKQRSPVPKFLVQPEIVKGAKILVVDDHPIHRKIIGEYLTSWECKFAEAFSPSGALELLRKAASENDPFQVAIVDFSMSLPDVSLFCQILKNDEALKDTLMILLTSIGKRGDAMKMRDIGFKAYLTKPIRHFQLFECLSTVLASSNHKLDVPIITKYSLAEKKKQSYRILMALDDFQETKRLQKMIEKNGYCSELVENGMGLVNAVKSSNFDLVFIDVSFSEVDAKEITKMIRNLENVSNKHLSVILLTGLLTIEAREQLLSIGMDEYLEKPVRQKELQAILLKFLPSGE